MSVLVRSVGAAAIAGAALFGSGAVASAQPAPPGCSIADQARVQAGVSTALSAYVFAHPEVNTFFSDLRYQPVEERRAKADEWRAQNPQLSAELEGIRQPMTEFRARCGLAESGDED